MKRPIFLDHNSTTPTDSRVVEAMLPYFTDAFGNPGSSTHKFGWEANAAVETAREQVAALIGASADEIIFTSGTTESNNVVLHHYFTKYGVENPEFIFSSIEHKAVLEPIHSLKKHNQIIHLLSVDGQGNIDFSELEKQLSGKTALLGLIYANNEIGTIQDIAKIGELAKERNALFFSDAAQAVGKIPVNVEHDKVDILTISAHKMYGPKGIGALYLRRKKPRVSISPLTFGGGQEKGLRSGTLNVPAIVGFGKACEIAKSEMESDSGRIKILRDLFEEIVCGKISDVQINGNKKNRLPNTSNLTFPSIKSSKLASELKQIAVSAGSACLSADNEPSHVLKSIGLTDEWARKTIRIGIGKYNTPEEIEFSANYLAETVQKLS